MLRKEQGYEVVCFLADVGQEEDWEAVKAKAVQIGATKMYVQAFRAAEPEYDRVSGTPLYG